MLIFQYISENDGNDVMLIKHGDDFYFDELVELLEKFGLAMGFMQGSIDKLLSYDEDNAYGNKGE